jgi:subtilisin family serine protease
MRVESIRSTGSVGARVAPRLLVPAVLLAALLLAVSSIFLAGSAHADDDWDEAVPRQIVVKLVPQASIGAVNEDYDTITRDKLLGSKKIYLLKVPKRNDPARVLERMQSDLRIIYAEPNFRTASPEGDARHRAFPGGVPEPSSDPTLYSDQYAIMNLNLKAAHAVTQGAGSVVAVIDTGVRLDHPELADSLTDARYDFIDDDQVPKDKLTGVDYDGDGEVDEMAGHGTHVAGIVKLAAPEARIMPLRALNSDGWGNVFVLAEAINYAANNGADVINLSLGASQESEFLMDILDNVAEGDEGMPGGAVVVAAAGNEDTSVEQYPAAGEDDILAVTSVDQERKKSSFANYGPWVDVAAPGSDIYSTFPTNQYATWSGTSMATPFVAGQAALLHSEVPTVGVESEDRVECVSNAIQTTARSLDALNPTYVGMLGDKGHADAGASVRYLRSNGCSLETDGGGD